MNSNERLLHSWNSLNFYENSSTKIFKFYDRIIAGSLFIVGNKNINKSKFRSKYGIYVISLLDGVM